MKAVVSPDVQQLWENWIKNKDDQAANDLIEHYMYLVQYHVERIASHIPDSFDKNDLKSLGLMGLFDALQKFDANRKLKFDTYASIRIRGSIMDGLRREDWLPRTLREQSKKIEKTTQELEQRLKRSPNSFEIAEELNMDREEIEDIVVNTLFANIISIDATYNTRESDDSTNIASTIEDDKLTSPDEHLIYSELKDELARNIKQLNENEQIVISLFYHEDLTLTEIGQILNLTTSRISQIHKRAIFKLRNTLKKLGAI